MLIETQVEKWDSSSSGPSWRLNLVVKFHLLHHHPRLCKLLNSIYQDTELRGLSNKTNLQDTDGNNRQWSFEIILPSKHIPKSFLSQKSELPKIPHLLNPIVTKSCWFYTPNFSPIIILPEKPQQPLTWPCQIYFYLSQNCSPTTASINWHFMYLHLTDKHTNTQAGTYWSTFQNRETELGLNL